MPDTLVLPDPTGRHAAARPVTFASSWTGRGLAAILVAACAIVSTASTATAARRDGSDFSCRASAARVAVKTPAATIEPIVANPTDAPCRADSAAILTPTPIGPITVNAAVATTAQKPVDLSTAPAANGDAALATAAVTNPAIVLGGLTVNADVLTAAASFTCQNGQFVPAGTSRVVSLTVNGQTIALPADNAPFTLDLGPLGSLSLNQTTMQPNRVTQRALSLTTPLADVVIAEAVADVSGNPCAVKPQCSDTFDNDGDGRIDAQDPGCLSGPGGTYNPNDNDERNQCTDGIDNDGDGRIDFPADAGCRSAQDNSERTPRGTARLSTIPSSIARLGLRGPCTSRSFVAVVRGRSIDRVAFHLDGRRIRTDTDAPFTARVRTARAGRHRVSARVTFLRDSRTRSRTLTVRFRRCPPAVRLTG